MPVSTGPSTSTPAPVTSHVEVIQKPRTLVLCFDGMADPRQYNASVTNVFKLYSLLAKDKVADQLCYYQAGMGTYFEPGVVRPFFHWWALLLDEAIAWYLDQHVEDSYKFLVQNYNQGDNVCLFGFSRGAYIARALAGMLHKVGLVANTEQIPFAYKLYTSACTSASKSHETLVAEFKEAFCRPVPINFLGVWDTVASVGILSGRTLPFVSVNTTIKVFRQALSLDEHRANFRPNLYHRDPTDKDKSASNQRSTNEAPHAASGQDADEVYGWTDVKEVWFPGCHCDIGGGNAKNTIHALSNIPLRWMIEQIVRSGAPIIFDSNEFAWWNIPTDILQDKPAAGPLGGVTVISDHDLALDAEQKLTDELYKQPLWWILEILPLKYTYQTPRGKWKVTWSLHLGGERRVPPGSLFHVSVKLRENYSKLKYKPRARYEEDTITYVR